MWRIISIATAILTFAGILFFFTKNAKRSIEENDYHLYGDSSYRDPDAPEEPTPPAPDIEPVDETSAMIH